MSSTNTSSKIHYKDDMERYTIFTIAPNDSSTAEHKWRMFLTLHFWQSAYRRQSDRHPRNAVYHLNTYSSEKFERILSTADDQVSRGIAANHNFLLGIAPIGTLMPWLDCVDVRINTAQPFQMPKT